jgi:serine/threonine protein kinase
MQGNFGDVFQGTYTDHNGKSTQVAVKSLRDAEDEKTSRLFLLEAQILSEFDHPNGRDRRPARPCSSPSGWSLERNGLATVAHPDACCTSWFAVLKLIGVTTSESPWCMVTELCALGDLRNVGA